MSTSSTVASATATDAVPTYRMLIDGQLVAAEGGRVFHTLSPADGRPLAAVPHASIADAERAVQAARAAFELGTWRNADGSMRAKVLNRIADLLEAHLEDFAQLEASDQGKPAGYARALEIPVVIDTFRHFAGWADKIYGETIPVPAAGLDFTLREPIGVCVGFAPNNYPLALAAFKIAPALAAGNSMVLKPSPATPLTALKLGELCTAAGLPDGVLNIITEPGHDVAAYLLEHPDVDLISLTGGTETGKLVSRAAAGTLKRVLLELGGKSPFIICPDADLDLAVTGALMGTFYNSGQTCTASTRLFVHRSVYDEFLDRFAAAADRLVVGHPLDEATNNGPLVTRAQYEKVLSYIELGRREGARLVTGGVRPTNLPETGNYLRPTVFADARNDMRIAREEIFGPVAAVIPFEDEDDAVAQANDSIYGLAASVWTRDIKRGLNLMKSLRVGQVWINNHNIFFPHAPFGGYKQSGNAREGGAEALRHYTQVKNVYVELGDVLMSPF
ncbi:MAG: aldehyde dehydrogenase family protein [Chloracidobacterium sp.]|nr:aldehyde dehydrogenase family protein [Chloracidobacterium sp.]MDW8217703.1 aldehyde dehydrogenase family protein [Acidobacteriota bacterium]